MNYSRFSGSRFVLPLLLVISLIGFVSCDGAGPGLEETDCCPDKKPPQEIPELSVLAERDSCFADTTGGGIIKLKATNGLIDSIETEYSIRDSVNNLIAKGIVSKDDSTSTEPVDYDGEFDVQLNDTVGDSARTSSDSALVNCKEVPAGPGQLKDLLRDCYDVANNRRDAKFGMTATLGFDRAVLFDVRKDSILTDSTGITPEKDQRIVWDRLYDSKFKSVLYKDGEKIYAEATFSCDVGPGTINVQTTCNAETGDAGYEITVANGFDFMPVNLNSEEYETYGDGTPEPDQTVSESDVPNGDYEATPERSGKTNSKSFSISCEEEQVPPIAKPKVDSTSRLTAYLNGLDSEDPDDESIETYKWTFPDGTVKYGGLTEFTFPEPGTYTVDLQVTDIDSLKDTAPVEVTVEPELKKCQCPVTLLGNGAFGVWGKAKGERKIAVENFEVLPKEPAEGSVGIRVDSRYGGEYANTGDGEPHEGFFIASRESGTSDYTIFSDNLFDPYTGIEYTWLMRDVLMSPLKFDVGIEHDFQIRHQSAPPKNLENAGGVDKIEFRVEGVTERGDYIRFEFLAYSCPEPYEPEEVTKSAMKRLTSESSDKY